jgi:parallel beta-helix repeat protein
LEKKKFLGIVLTLVLLVMLYKASDLGLVTGWSNGGYSPDPQHPLYGTHDWIAEHALDWLPLEERQYLQNNLAAYLYGTELPDDPSGIGDSARHHIYYRSNGSLQDDASAVRAYEEYNKALHFLEIGMLDNASQNAGIMSHYIVDVAVFGHVMASGTDWGPETHHEDYETYVNDKTNSYEDEFNEYLAFDGELRTISAYDAARELAYDTTSDVNGDLTCVWMDQHYDWSNPTFRNRCGESLNLAVNYLADVLHTLYKASVSATRYPWSMFRHDLIHTGYTESPAPNTNRTLWKYTAGGYVSYSSPAVVDGKAYVGSEDHKVYCLNAYTGEYVWSYTTGDWVLSSPAVVDGRVYVGSCDCRIYCLDASTGGHIWNYTTGAVVYSSSPAVANGKVYVGSYDRRVYCLDAYTGVQVWNYTTGDVVTCSPAVVNGRVYVGSDDSRIYCLDAYTGALIWSHETGDYIGYSSPAVVDGRVYVGSADHKVYCFYASTGELAWNYTTGDLVFSSPAVANGKVYVGSYDQEVYCLNAYTGALIWSYETGDLVFSSPAVADGRVYVGSYDSKVYCLDAYTGEHIWSYTTGWCVASSPAVSDGVVFIGSLDKAVYALGDVIRVPEDYTTIQDAINAAPPEATISIALGTYHESLVINKPLTILGRKGSNPVFDGGGSGIAITLLPGASGSTIAGIIITHWNQGVFILNSSNCKIYDNTMSLMGSSGIALQGSNAANNRIYNNIFQGNAIAINLTESSTSNIIYHNSFLNNVVQVYISMAAANTWDDGYPSGGNYWSDYIGADQFSGPNQDQPGTDGIGDTPYVICSPDHIDRYPLTPHHLGDLDGDFDVDEDDLWHFCGSFIDYYKIHVLDPKCDFDNNSKIDEDDLWKMCTAFIDYWKQH